MERTILTINHKEHEKFLRSATTTFTFETDGTLKVGGDTLTKRQVGELIADMRAAMQGANGVGLSANQIGLPYRMFVAKVPDAQGRMKFYAIFNPKISVIDGTEVLLEEGCLSIKRTYGNVPRAKQVLLTGLERNGRQVKIRAWGLLARVFQHEVDHLEGKLFIDRTKDTHVLEEAGKSE